MQPGSLFPALHRTEEAGWLKSSWGSQRTIVELYYRLTKAGQRQLEAETEDWQRIAIAIKTALKATEGRLYATTAALIQPLA